jgi:hypothetical protein
MEKYIKITTVYDEDGNEAISYKSEGFNEFEIIGLLTYYRDSIEIKAMKTADENMKAQIATKHGIFNGFTIHSNPEIARRNLYAAMDEYAEYASQNHLQSSNDKVIIPDIDISTYLEDDSELRHSSQRSLTDEEIEKWAKSNYLHYWIKVVEGAKWYRDRQKGGKP